MTHSLAACTPMAALPAGCHPEHSFVLISLASACSHREARPGRHGTRLSLQVQPGDEVVPTLGTPSVCVWEAGPSVIDLGMEGTQEPPTPPSQGVSNALLALRCQAAFILLLEETQGWEVGGLVCV